MTADRSAAPETKTPARIVLARGAMFFALWLVLMQSTKPGDLAVGALATLAATWASLRLLPPQTGRVRFFRLLALVPRFLWQSLIAGIDVARRVFAPSLPLHTGFVDYPHRLPAGAGTQQFRHHHQPHAGDGAGG